MRKVVFCPQLVDVRVIVINTVATEMVKGDELFNKVSRGRLREDVARKYF